MVLYLQGQHFGLSVSKIHDAVSIATMHSWKLIFKCWDVLLKCLTSDHIASPLIGPHIIHGPPGSPSQTATRSVLQRSRSRPPERHTDHATYDVAIGHILVCIAMWSLFLKYDKHRTLLFVALLTGCLISSDRKLFINHIASVMDTGVVAGGNNMNVCPARRKASPWPLTQHRPIIPGGFI